MYEPLEAHCTWDAPQYDPLPDDDVADVPGTITDRPYWLTASNHDVPELHAYLRGVIKATPRAAPFSVYVSQARTRIVAPRQPIEPVKAPRLREGEELVGPLRLSLLKPGQFNALRSRAPGRRSPERCTDSWIRPGSAPTTPTDYQVLKAHLPQWEPAGVLDTLRLAKATLPDLPRYNLDALITAVQPDLREAPAQRHRATYDAFATAQLLIALANHYDTWDALVAAAVPRGLPGAPEPEKDPTLW